jgi:hypothetical protein
LRVRSRHIWSGPPNGQGGWEAVSRLVKALGLIRKMCLKCATPSKFNKRCDGMRVMSSNNVLGPPHDWIAPPLTTLAILGPPYIRLVMPIRGLSVSGNVQTRYVTTSTLHKLSNSVPVMSRNYEPSPALYRQSPPPTMPYLWLDSSHSRDSTRPTKAGQLSPKTAEQRRFVADFVADFVATRLAL